MKNNTFGIFAKQINKTASCDSPRAGGNAKGTRSRVDNETNQKAIVS